jgi:hypothetical protein
MTITNPRAINLWLTLSVLAAVLGGCAYSPEHSRAVALTGASDRVVNYPEGRYQLYGDGTSTPYYWVWIPAGTSPPPAPLPPSPRVQASEGRYQLYGDGIRVPYYWVWVPAGATLQPPPPPPVPQASQLR